MQAPIRILLLVTAERRARIAVMGGDRPVRVLEMVKEEGRARLTVVLVLVPRILEGEELVRAQAWSD